MGRDAKNFLAQERVRFLCLAILIGMGACAMSLHFYFSGRDLIAISGDHVLVRQAILSQIVCGMASAILWCVCISYAEAFMFARFLSRLVDRIEEGKRGAEAENAPHDTSDQVNPEQDDAKGPQNDAKGSDSEDT
jgi:hypothetical protein